ncbi:hypothetical protein AgCh_039219 [Apium graveolens]
MEDCKPVSTPTEASIKLRIDSTRESVNPTLFESLVGSLRYLTFTHADIMYVVGLVSRYMEKPKQDHFMASKRILRYIKGIVDQDLQAGTPTIVPQNDVAHNVDDEELNENDDDDNDLDDFMQEGDIDKHHLVPAQYDKATGEFNF